LHTARSAILNRSWYARARLDISFAALSDATRRGVLEQLRRSDASITDLAEKFRDPHGHEEARRGFGAAGLVDGKLGRVRTCKLGTRRFRSSGVARGITTSPGSRFDELDKVVEELKRKEKIDERKKRQ
jgi:DNA-binding transcriptional ArsR family regulator